MIKRNAVLHLFSEELHQVSKLKFSCFFGHKIHENTFVQRVRRVHDARAHDVDGHDDVPRGDAPLHQNGHGHQERHSDQLGADHDLHAPEPLGQLLVQRGERGDGQRRHRHR